MEQGKHLSLTQKVAYSTGLNMAKQAIIVVSGLVVARLVGPEVLGLLAYAGAFVGMFAALSDFGFGTAHIKRVSEGRDLGQCMGMIWLAKVSSLLVMTGAVLVAFWSGGQRSFVGAEQRAVFYVALATLVASQLSMVPIVTLTAFQDVFRKDVPPVISEGVNALLRVPIAILGFGTVALASVDLTTSVLLLLAYFWLLRRLPMRWPSRAIMKGYVTFGAPMFLVALLTSVGGGLDRVLLRLFAGVAAVGQYSTGMRLGAVLQFLSAAVAGLVFPSMSRSYATGHPEEAFALCGRAERRLALVLFPLMLGIVGISRPLALLLLGAKYADTGPVIAFGTAAMVFQTLTQPYSQMLFGAERMTSCIIVHSILFVVQGALLYLFLAGPASSIPGLNAGAPGAAVAVAMSSLVAAVLWRTAAVRLLGGRLEKRIWIHVSSALVLLVLAYSLTSILGGHAFGATLAVAGGSVVAHLFVLRCAGELGSGELQFLRELLPIRNALIHKHKAGRGRLEGGK